MESNFSQTQIANFSTIAGLLVLILPKLGILASQDQVLFFIGAAWSLGSVVYNYWQRYKKGDLTLGGMKKK